MLIDAVFVVEEQVVSVGNSPEKPAAKEPMVLISR